MTESTSGVKAHCSAHRAGDESSVQSRLCARFALVSAILNYVRRTADRVKAYPNRTLLVWTEQRYCELYLFDGTWPAGWIRLSSNG